MHIKVRKYTTKFGFTIVELLIVIVVIAILAAIVVVAYNGINTKARQSTLISDARAVANTMSNDNSRDGMFASSASGANNGAGLAASEGTTYSYHSDGSTFCVTARSSYSGVESYFVSSANLTPSAGQCPQDAGSQVTTLAGSGTLGFANGTGTAAVVASPAAMAADGSGNLYFTDSSTSRIRKVTTGGVVTTLAGNGNPAYVEGTGTGASFSGPQALTVGASDELIIADTNNHKVRKLSTANVSSFFSGSTQGNAGTVGTAPTAIRYNVPRGIVFNGSSGTVVVSDAQNNRILRLDSGGSIAAVIGQTSGGFTNATGVAAQFNYPRGLAVDSAGNIYVADTQNHAIRKISPANVVTTIAGTGTVPGYADGAALSARFTSPGAVAVASDGSIYISDSGNHRIRKLSADGTTVTTVAGDGTAGFADGYGTETKFNQPNGLAIGSDGRLYVSDMANHRIRALTLP